MNSRLKEFISILNEIGTKNISPEATKAVGDLVPILNAELEKNSLDINDNKIASWAMTIISLIPEIMQNKNDPLPVFLRSLDVTKIDLSDEVLEVYFGKENQPQPSPQFNRRQ